MTTTKVPAAMLGFTPATDADLSLAAVPIGGGLDYWGSTLPGSGWKWADGSAISRTTYATAFARLGTAFGSGDGTTTFNLPDKRGRVSAARDDLGGTAAARLTSAVSGVNATTLGASGGDQRLQQHTHAVTITDPGHFHGLPVRASAGSGSFIEDTDDSGSSPAVNSASATTGITASAANAGAGSSENVQPTIVCNYIIRVL